MVRFLSSFRITQKLGFPALNSTDGSSLILEDQSSHELLGYNMGRKSRRNRSVNCFWSVCLVDSVVAEAPLPAKKNLQVNLGVMSYWLNTARLVQSYSSTVVERVSYPDMRNRIVPILLNLCSVLKRRRPPWTHIKCFTELLSIVPWNDNRIGFGVVPSCLTMLSTWGYSLFSFQM